MKAQGSIYVVSVTKGSRLVFQEPAHILQTSSLSPSQHTCTRTRTDLSQLTDGKGRAVAGRDGHNPPPPQRRRAPRHAQALEGASPAVFLRVHVVVLVVRRNLVLVQVLDNRAVTTTAIGITTFCGSIALKK